MRTLLIALVLAAAPAVAEPVKNPPAKDARASLDVWVPEIHITELSITGGGLQPQVLHQALGVLDEAVPRCYQKAEAQSRKLAGSLAVRFRLDGKGTATNITVTGVPGMTGCVTEAIKIGPFSGPQNGPIDLREKLSLRLVAVRGGILGSTTLGQGGAFASLTGTGDISSGVDDGTLSGLVGTESGSAIGTVGGLGPKGPAATTSSGQITAQGDLDKAIIRRYIRRNIQKLQYCYEKELLSSPKLAGTVTAKFTIGVTGKVTSSTASGLSSTKTSSCIADVIGAIEFPKPKGGGEVVVSYPFTFHASDDDNK